MAITYPLDLLADFPGWTPVFELAWRQETSRTAGGATLVKDLGSPLWHMTAASRPLRPNELDAWRARLDLMEGGLQTFMGYSMTRCYPIAYPNGSWPTGASFDGVSAAVYDLGGDNKSLKVDGLPEGFALGIGDMIQIKRGSTTRRDLHRVMAAATADSNGRTGLFEVRPHLWPGVAVDDVVSVKRPWCLMRVVPGSVSTQADAGTGRGSVSFEAIEAR